MDFKTLVDGLLELSIVGSFSRPGMVLRRSLFGWESPSRDALAGRTVLVTGPTSGLGLAATQGLAALGARVILVGRNHERLTALRDALTAAHGADRFPIAVADMSSLASVRSAVRQITQTEDRLDVLVDNAGALYRERAESPDGLEATLAILVVGPFALISGLMPLLKRTRRARVISVTSGGQYTQRVHFDDLAWTAEPYSGSRAYAQAKRMQVVLVREWATRLRGSGVRINAMHPGWADTPGLAEALPGFYRVMRPWLRTPAEGADTILWLATERDAGADGGQLFLDRRARPFDRVPTTRLSAAERRHVWDVVARLAGIA